VILVLQEVIKNMDKIIQIM